MDEVKIVRQAIINQEAEHHSCRKPKSQQSANQIPSFSSWRISNIEDGKLCIDQDFKAKWIQETHEDGDDQKGRVVTQTFFS